MRAAIFSILFLMTFFSFGQEKSIRLRHVIKPTDIRETVLEDSKIIASITPKDKIYFEYFIGKKARIEFYNKDGRLLNGYISADLLEKKMTDVVSGKEKSATLAKVKTNLD